MNPSIAAIMTKKSVSTAGLRSGQSAIEWSKVAAIAVIRKKALAGRAKIAMGRGGLLDFFEKAAETTRRFHP